MKRTTSIAVLAFLLPATTGQESQAQLPIYSEDFETVALGPSPEEDPTFLDVWSKSGPTGWIVDDSGMPGAGDPANDGVTDWAGWAFTDKETFWGVVTDDQDRQDFTRGRGTVLVADADEWEDATVLPAAQQEPYNFFDAKVTSAVISIPTGIPAGKLKLAFDSSWKPEGLDDGDVGELNNQTATVKAIYDTGSPKEVLKWDSDTVSPTFKDNAVNEGVEVDLQYNGTDTTVKLQFELGQAWNDWWWAIDNIRVFVPADPSILRIDVGTGVAEIIGGDVINTGINSIDIQSLNGNLSPSGNVGLSYTKPDSIDATLDLDSIVGNSINETWQLAAANANFFSEFFLSGHSDFTNSRTETLGHIFDTTTPVDERDVAFTYTNIFGDEIAGLVEYVGNISDADFDGDGDIDGRDFLKWQRGYGLMGQTNNANGDANGDGTVNNLDLVVWQAQYGPASLGSVTAVPEPNGWILVAIAGVYLVLLRSQRRVLEIFGGLPTTQLAGLKASVALLAALGSVPTFGAVIPPPTLDRLYRFGGSDGVISGTAVTTTKDDAGVGPSSTQQLVPLSGFAGSGAPTFITVTGRPDGVGGLGIRLNPSNSIVQGQYLATLPQLALNLPIRSPSSTESDFGTGTLDYKFITDRGFQLWVRPSALPIAGNRADIVMDSNNHGVYIRGDGKFAMRYAGFDYSGITTAATNTWHHLMVVRPFGPGSGSILYVNGIAEAADTGLYLGEQDLTAEEVLLPTQIDDSPLVIGANTSETPSAVGKNNFFKGIVDDLEMFVMGYNNSADYGEFVFERDNKYAAFFKPTVAGDVNGDGQVTISDVSIFASNWLYEKKLEWLHKGLTTDERSLVVGDLSTRALGDFDFSGRIDLGDWAILNEANPSLAALAMARIQGVPEPSSIMFLLTASTTLLMRRRGTAKLTPN